MFLTACGPLSCTIVEKFLTSLTLFHNQPWWHRCSNSQELCLSYCTFSPFSFAGPSWMGKFHHLGKLQTWRLSITKVPKVISSTTNLSAWRSTLWWPNSSTISCWTISLASYLTNSPWIRITSDTAEDRCPAAQTWGEVVRVISTDLSFEPLILVVIKLWFLTGVPIVFGAPCSSGCPSSSINSRWPLMASFPFRLELHKAVMRTDIILDLYQWPIWFSCKPISSFYWCN